MFNPWNKYVELTNIYNMLFKKLNLPLKIQGVHALDDPVFFPATLF